MKALWRPVAALTVAALTFLSGGTATAETPSPSPGDSLYTGCSGDGVTPGPTGEKDANGKTIVPTASPAGTWTPVILVHGWGEGPDAFDGPANLFGDGGDGGAPLHMTTSITGRLQAIPGVALYRFDYREYASRWVTDQNIGPRLAKAIECLTNHYGQKAAIVAHSMGGLATRFALATKDAAGESLSSRVAQVSTFGTPNEGSLLAAAAAVIAGTATAAAVTGPAGFTQDVIVAAWMFVQSCGREFTAGTSHVTGLCSKVPGFIGSFDSDGGRALRSGSGELAALPKWPSGVEVQAVKGTINLAGIAFINHPLDGSPWINIGDLPVSNASAVSGATTTIDEPCSLQLFGRGGSLQFVPDGDIKSGAPATLFGSPCFHLNLMRTLNGVNPVVQSIRTLAGTPSSLPSVSSTSPASPSGFATSGPGWYPVTRSDRVRDGDLNAYEDSENLSIQAKTYAYGLYDTGSFMGYNFDTKEDGIDFALGGRCTRFQADLGIWSKAPSTASTSDAKVSVDGRTVVTGKIGYYTRPVPIDLDVSGATRIRISNGWDTKVMQPPALALGEPRVYCTSDPFNN